MKDQRETREATTALMTRVQYQGLVYGARLIAAYNKLNITQMHNMNTNEIQNYYRIVYKSGWNN